MIITHPYWLKHSNARNLYRTTRDFRYRFVQLSGQWKLNSRDEKQMSTRTSGADRIKRDAEKVIQHKSARWILTKCKKSTWRRTESWVKFEWAKQNFEIGATKGKMETESWKQNFQLEFGFRTEVSTRLLFKFETFAQVELSDPRKSWVDQKY